ncbi:MAG: hypothetical protein AB8I08_22550 [Sandaracinaceae bacterium]
MLALLLSGGCAHHAASNATIDGARLEADEMERRQRKHFDDSVRVFAPHMAMRDIVQSCADEQGGNEVIAVRIRMMGDGPDDEVMVETFPSDPNLTECVLGSTSEMPRSPGVTNTMISFDGVPPREAGASPELQAAEACRFRGDSRCVIDTLSGRVNGQRGMHILIDSHRSLGQRGAAVALMREYARRWEHTSMAARYAGYIDAHERGETHGFAFVTLGFQHRFE